jgi:hypothetical protein
LLVWLEKDTEMVVIQRCGGEGGGHAVKVVWKLYLMSKYPAFKVLRVLDNVPGHPKGLCFAHLNIQVEYLS